MNQDKLVHATAANSQLRCMAAITTALVNEACRRHQTFPTASAALGRVLTGALLMGAGVKDLEKITVHFACDGPIGNIIAQADAHANVRGYVSNPVADATENGHGKLDVRAVVGTGTLYVTRDAGFEIGLMKEPYRGTVPIVSGEIGEDFAYYLARSEQVNSAVSLGVLMTVDPDGSPAEIVADSSAPEFTLERLRVAAAGGFIVQVMPSADERLVAYLEHALPRAPHSTEMIRSGMGPADMLRRVLGELDLQVLEEKPPRFHCQCSKERAVLIVSALGRDEVEDMLAKDDGAELICHFCNEAYQLTAEDLSGILGGEEMRAP